MIQLIVRQKKGKSKIYYIFLFFIIFLIAWKLTATKQDRHQKDLVVPQIEAREASAASREIIVATTTSLVDSGLLEALIPLFEKDSGFRVKILAVGSGEALEMGRRQVADLLLVHVPEMEKKFMEAGFGQLRQEIMSSDFIIAGPASDPAQIRGQSFPQALKAIALNQSYFVSRSDNSGTHFLEKRIWKEIGIEPSGKWYLETGQGMAESLRVASEKQAYILADYPTFHQLKSTLRLEILSRDPNYRNIYSAIVVKGNTDRVNQAGAKALVDFLVSPKAQKLISEFGVEKGDNSSLFQPLKMSLKEDR